MPYPHLRSLCLVAFAIAPLVTGCPSDTEPVGAPAATETTTLAVLGGEVDRTSTAVVGLASNIGMCSGTLIAPNLVLTARHCVAPSADSQDCDDRGFGATMNPSDLGITTETSITRRSDFYSVSEIWVSDGEEFCDNDIAVVVLSESIPTNEATPRTPRIDEAITLEEGYEAVGYGNPDAGTRHRIGERTVLCKGLTCGAVEQLGRVDWVGDGGVCSGDSGGPAFDVFGRVIGVASRADEDCEISIYTSVPDWSEWLRDAAVEAAELGGYTAPDWAITGKSYPEGDPDFDDVTVEFDNCPNVQNPDQRDVDNDGLGDACDPTNDAVRGGDCPVCDGCAVDADCTDDAICVDSERGGICTYACTVDADCPFNTICGGDFCVNDTYVDRGVCDGAFVCIDRGAPVDVGVSEDAGLDTGSGSADAGVVISTDAGGVDTNADAADASVPDGTSDADTATVYVPPSSGGCSAAAPWGTASFVWLFAALLPLRRRS